MAKYRAKEKGFDGMQIIEEGRTFDFHGTPGHWMEPLDAEAKAKIALLKPIRGKKGLHGKAPKAEAEKKPAADGKDAKGAEGSASGSSDGKSAI